MTYCMRVVAVVRLLNNSNLETLLSLDTAKTAKYRVYQLETQIHLAMAHLKPPRNLEIKSTKMTIHVLY